MRPNDIKLRMAVKGCISLELQQMVRTLDVHVEDVLAQVHRVASSKQTRDSTGTLNFVVMSTAESKNSFCHSCLKHRSHPISLLSVLKLLQ